MIGEEAKGQERFEKFLKVFAEIGESTKNLVAATKNSTAISQKHVEIANKFIDATNNLFVMVTKPNDGLLAAIDDLILEVQGLREDLRANAKASGVSVDFSSLLGKRRRG
jgi:hypothetical protein